MGYDDMRVLILADRSAEKGVGATKVQLDVAESQVGVIPREYEQFLLEFGWLAIGPFELFGLGSDVPPHLNLISMTLDERENFGLPEACIAIMNDGGGNIFCFDSSGEGSVFLWEHDGGPEHKLIDVADSFADWMVELLSPRR